MSKHRRYTKYQSTLKKHAVTEQRPSTPLTSSPNQLDNELVLANREHAEYLPSFQTNLERQIEYSDASTRWLHTKCNPYAHKHTYGFVDAVFNHQPYLFRYVSETDDLEQAVDVKSMARVHQLWNQADMFRLFKELQAQALGVGSAWLVKIAENTFLIFNESQIYGNNYWRDPETRQLTEVWFEWNGADGGYIGNSTQNFKNSQYAIVHAKIGENAVQFTPNPSTDKVFGESELASLWTTCIRRNLNEYYTTLFIKKGGVTSRIAVLPDAMDTTSRRLLRKEANKGMESELVQLFYPNAIGLDAQKMVSVQENKGSGLPFKDIHGMLAENSPLPPSFIEGPASGAMGGQAPVQDAKTINRILLSYASRIQRLVKDINQVFFFVGQTNYMVIPYIVVAPSPDTYTDIDEDSDLLKDENNDKLKKDEPKVKPNGREICKSSSFKLKAHSHSSEGGVVYEGNLWEEGVYEYDDLWDEGQKIYEHLSGAELQKFVDDPMSVKEVYLSAEHPYEVNKENAIGKLVVKGWKEVNGVVRDVSELHFKPEFNPMQEKIFLSPVYYAHLQKNSYMYNGKEILDQTDISLLNAGVVLYPRSALTGLETSAEKSV